MRYITTPHEAELNAAEVMRSWGYEDAVATTGGADGGIDVRSSRALAQVKWKGGVTGRPDVQNLYGARGNGTQRLFFFSASGYSDQAVAYADDVGIGLFTYDPSGAVLPASEVAESVKLSPQVSASMDWGFVGLLAAGAAVIAISLAVLL
ncbi:restriction endonuclease [Tsukamurella tyrosinosolvens]|uniref:restriction endonuclease n=1 Tax=Tsukamurella tyrosinosolvens TaxID=57704 RepID=UPI001CE11E70|nr:restriction endonuclease [Tsukamurella tyrosinosolvens]MCA4995111.1 restriction endonuclease [Tsukamurella tyrosinosolvens]